jgi:DNA-directed RNA polymerase subunit K/omega
LPPVLPVLPVLPILPILPILPVLPPYKDFDMNEPISPADEQTGLPVVPAEPLPPIQSRFLFVDVAALRAKQLRRGARIRIDDIEHLPKKAERVAMEEVRRGLVYYNVLDPRLARAESES